MSKETAAALREIKMEILKIHPADTAEHAMQTECLTVIEEYITNHKED